MTTIDQWCFDNDPGYYDDMPKEKTTPCDYPDEEGNHHCPYEDYTGYEGERCRVCCGLGVDE